MRALLLVAALACGGAPAPLDQTVTSAHYTFLFSAGDRVDVEWQETYHAWLVAELALPADARLEYRKYVDREHLRALTGKETNGFAELSPPRVHTIWPIDNHEVVHALVMAAWGSPPALFNEGIAVAHSMDPARHDFVARWNGQDVHAIARSADIPPLDGLLASRAFFEHDTQVTYPIAGSFVRYLLDTRGQAPMRQLFAATRFDGNSGDTQLRFQQAYGMTIASAWSEWQAWLR